MDQNHNALETPPQGSKRFDLYHVGKWGAIAIIAYYLLTEHRAHVLQFLPYLFLLACPLMHFFMHGSHSHHHHHHHGDEKKERR